MEKLLANCVYIEDESSSEFKDFAALSADGHHCPAVPIHHYARHRGFKVNKGSPGLVTTGAGPCMVVVLHNKALDTGCMAHINECVGEAASHDLADIVIDHMQRTLTGATNTPLDLVLLSGKGFFRTYGTRAARNFENCQVLNHLNNGRSNYVYYPNHAQVFAVEDAQFVHGLTTPKEPVAVQFNRAEVKFTSDPMIDFFRLFDKFATRDL